LQIPTDGAIKITVVQVSNPVTNKLLGADQRRRGVGSLVQCSNHITSHYIGEWRTMCQLDQIHANNALTHPAGY
jgi:hypothetical protein